MKKYLLGALLMMVVAVPGVYAQEEILVKTDSTYMPLKVVSSVLEDVELDSTWLNMGPGLSGTRVAGSETDWAVSYQYYRLASDLNTLYTLEEFNKIIMKQKYGDEFQVVPVYYIRLIKGSSAESAAREANSSSAWKPTSELMSAVRASTKEFNEKEGKSEEKSKVKVIRPGG